MTDTRIITTAYRPKRPPRKAEGCRVRGAGNRAEGRRQAGSATDARAGER
jgi:hypothetical protein